MRSARRLAFVLAVACALAGSAACKKTTSSTPEVTTPLKVAAAADLAFAFKDIGDAFEKSTGRKVVFSFGSTGLLAKQIVEGAPFDVFAAANVSYVDEVVRDGGCLADSKSSYAQGRIVMWAKDGTAPPKALADLSKPSFVKVAIANPEHAPYGRAAKQAMTKAGVWDAVATKAVYGENVQQTLQFAQSGNAEVAVVALSLAIVSGGSYTSVDTAMHEPLEQALVVCKGSPQSAGQMQPIARSFTAFVNSEQGRTIMKRFGFLLPGESTSARAN